MIEVAAALRELALALWTLFFPPSFASSPRLVSRESTFLARAPKFWRSYRASRAA
jgi:hypothetical protein